MGQFGEMDFNAWFERLTDIASVCRTEDMLKDALQELVADLGFDCYAYMYVQPSRTFAVSNYPAEWQKLYFDRGYLAIDPVVKTAKTTLRTFTWHTASPCRPRTHAMRRFNSEAADFGIKSGITIPIRTAGRHMSMLTLASNEPALTLDKDIDHVAAAIAVTYLHTKFEQFNAAPTARETFELTPRQALCLKWSAEGKTMKDIAAIENMSFATANFHLNNARKVLDALSLAQATALATKLGLI